MDANGNQRKRTGRSSKNANNNDSLSPTHESIEPLEVSAVAISPTLEEAESSTNAPVSECRRSSRKKIIKFDVRDLLNKNRKTHKIQIEARIDSNAPTTSKASVAVGGGESTNSKTSTAKEDLLSKQKTFLEKSAIFRRYSISQEHKPPPPPLPMPPLLGKANDNKESVISGSSTNRRLSRTQEFFSNVMIKPKQTTSLIVAQIESNTPSTSTTTSKRRSLNKSVDQETKTAMSSDQEIVANTQQRKRGRPAKFKTPEAVNIGVVEEIETKKISPEKATNWKEYKACLAQQTESSENKIEQQLVEKPKEDIVKSLQSNISRSDDNGNFSKEDTSNLPVLEKFDAAKDIDDKDSPNMDENKKIEEIAKIDTENILVTEITDSEQVDINKTNSSNTEQKLSEKKDSPKVDISMQSAQINIQQNEYEALNKIEKKTETTEEEATDHDKSSSLKKADKTQNEEKTAENLQNQETANIVDYPKEVAKLEESKDDKSISEIVTDDKEPLVKEGKTVKQPIRSKRRQLNKGEKDVIPTSQIETAPEEIILESNKILDDKITLESTIEESPSKSTRKSKTPDIVKAAKLIDECSPLTKLTTSDILLITSQLTPSHPPTPEETTKSSSRTSSSSESENASTYSSDPASTSSSSSTSSSRSYKSGDKLRVSLKRISLPKSPSTSSQTSTSEELNSGLNPQVVKKKPPIGKRSKRLQRKLLNESENIDDCFQKIEDKQNDEEILITQNTEALENPETSKNIVKIFTEFLEKDNSTETSKCIAITKDAISTNTKLEKDTSTVVKRKSLRNRKENINDDIEIPIDDKAANEEENKSEQIGENRIELENQTSLESDQSEETENKQIRKTKNSKPIKQRPQRKLKKLISSGEEEKSNNEESKEIMAASETINNDVQETGTTGQSIDDDQYSIAEKSINEINSTDSNKSSVKLTDEEKTLSITTTTRSKMEVMETKIQEHFETINTVEIEIQECSLNENYQQQKSIKTRSKTNKEVNILEEAAEGEEVNKLSDQEEKTRSKTNKDDIHLEETTSLGATETIDETRKVFKTKASLKAKLESLECSVPTISDTIIALDKTSQSTATTCKLNVLESDAAEQYISEPEVNDKSVSEYTKTNISSEENETRSSKETSKEEISKQNSEIIVDNVIEEVSESLLENTYVLQESTDKSALTTKKTDKSNSEEIAIVTVTRSKANKETVSSNEMDIQIDKSTEDQKHEKVAATSEDNKTLILTDNIKVDDAKGSVTKTKSNKNDTDETPQSKTKTKSEISITSTETIEDMNPESLENVESDVKEKLLSAKRSVKNLDISAEFSETTQEEMHVSPKTSDKNVDNTIEISQLSQHENLEDKDNVNVNINEDKPSLVNADSNEISSIVDSTECVSEVSTQHLEHKTQEIVKDAFDKDPPTSTKRKSLRNQKEKVATEESLTLVTQTAANEDNSLQQKGISNSSSQKDVKQQNEIVPEEDIVKPTKRRSRKSRFKNLHTPDVESETDSNNGNNTPIAEILQQKQIESVKPIAEILQQTEQQIELDKPAEKDETKVATVQAQEMQDSNKNDSEIADSCENESVKTKVVTSQISEDVKYVTEIAEINKNEPAKASFSTSQIQNVSIETNTLLDILRTVQSNTEAALKASKSSTEVSSKSCIEEPSTQDCIQKPQGTTLISPTRSATNSPLTLKRMPISPTRSDSSSPLTIKKVIQSPSRSDSSSPLTLKKITRRYERRSRRGEDSSHKTLEETFAEIAAQSSKAVLAAKEQDINVPITDENPLKEIPNIEMEQQITESLGTTEKSLVCEEDSVKTNEEDRKKTVENVSQTLENTEKVLEELKPLENEIKNPEKSIETGESCKVTPARRGRKPKQRNVESAENKEQSKELCKETIDTNPKEISSNVIELKEETKEKQHELDERKEKQLELNEVSQVENIRSEEAKIEAKTTKTKKSKEIIQTEVCAEVESKSSANLPTISSQNELKEILIPTFSKNLDDKTEIKSNKKPFKKRDSFKTETASEESANLDVTVGKEKEDELRTPKQLTKKRDTSQTKSETKSIGKKSTKKTKNDEEEPLNATKDDNLTKTISNLNTTTTPPPSKRGRKPKNQQETPQSLTASKKKNKKDQTTTETIESDSMPQEKSNTLESESELDKSFDEKLAKKKRQKKLKEAFEAALTEDLNKVKEPENSESSTNLGLTRINKSPTPPQKTATTSNDASLKITCVTPVEADEEPDPLKDIEKFIADGVNLLKKDYKLDEDSVEDVLTPTPAKTTEVTTEESIKSSTEETETKVFNTYETPADTPVNTPSATPPPKSPTSIESSTPDENSGVRRSHRLKLITKTPKALVGRGLVRDKERFSIKDDVETKSHYTLDDHLTDLAEVEAKNAKFLKEMEERLSNFQVIKENEYLCERVISKEARKMICDCFLTHEEEERGELGCGEDCLNRLLMIECGPDCNVKDRCTNKRFQKLLCSPCRVFRTEKKGFGIMADIEILPGEFIMEYVGEVIDTDEFEKRRIAYSQDKNRHYYFMALRSDAIIDATIKGNISRFINHSCDPNAETQKWTVNGELRIGFFSRKSIMPGEEITFNYQYQRYGREAQRCYCESANCTGWIGQEPTSDEGEQIDDEDDDESEDEEEEADTSNLLVQDDDEDSDASVADPEEVQKQLEMAAAQAEVELAPIQLLEEKDKEQKLKTHEGKSELDVNKNESDEDSKSKFKKLLSKMAEKVAAKQKQTKREQKMQRKKKSKESSGDLANKMKFLEDPDIEDEVEFLKECGLKNQSDTLRLSRLMVRAKLVQTRLNLLEILRKGDLPCRRLFLDYHGLRLLHGWMSEDAGNMQIRLSLLQTLETLPIANKTVLTDSKVMQVVRNWCGNNTNLSPNDDSSSSNSNSQDVTVANATNTEEGTELAGLQKLALKLITTWEGLPEIFRIPKKERIEQMKEHEREADRQYAANAETQQNSNSTTDRYRRDRFGRGFNTSAPNTSSRFNKPNNGNQHRTANTTPENIKNLSKAQRREMFEAKVARDEAEKRLAEERREFETKCRFFGLDPKKTRPQDIPFCVNPATGQWFSIERKPITTPPSYAHVQVPVKPKSTDPNDYQLPAVCSTLPPQWKYAITPQGKIYYYHIKHRIPQWEPPTAAQLQECELEDREEDSESELTTTAGEDSSDDDDEVLIGMDAAQLKAYIDRKVELRRQKRYQRLVDERSISPRREEDRIYNQIEVRKYKENKEKIRKRKEEIRRKRAEALRQTSLNMCTLGAVNEANPNTNKTATESDEELGALPIQDYLLSSDEEVDFKAEVNSPLMDKIVEGDKIVDELDALTTKRQLKRPLPPHRDLSEASTSSGSSTGLSVALARQEYKKRKLEKKEKRKPKEQQDAKYRKNKEKFRCEIAGIIVHHLKPYLKDTCTVGRIQSNEDFNHLARKLTHFVMIKELKYCESVGQTLVVTESVKSKSREFIKKYMAKYGEVYVKPTNDPDFKDIPFTL